MEPSQSVFQKHLVPISIVVAGALIAGAVYFSDSATGGPSQGDQPSVNIKDVKIHPSDPVLGDKNARVTLAYWFDYQCPFCKAFDIGHEQIPIEPTLPILMKEYVETGKLKIVFKDYAFLGPDSETAALYKHAVWEMYPDTFYEWHEAMFEAQDEENGGFGDEESILKLIRGIAGLDADALKAKVAEKRAEYLALAEANKTEGTKFGIQGTPGVITGKVLIPGADSPAAFKAAIDAQL